MRLNVGYIFLISVVILVAIEGKIQKQIQFELKRNVLTAWAKNSTKYVNDFCYSPKHSRPSRPLIFHTPMPTNCSQTRVARISQECVFKNLAYNVKFFYDATANSTLTSAEKNPKVLDSSPEYVELAIDLTSPWSWIKSPVCQTCDRRGSNCQANQCHYSQNTAMTFDRSFSCANCQIIDKCGEIDSYAEGMSVVGQFVTPNKLRFKDALQPLKDFKFLWAHALSGQQFLMADGVLGLGMEFNANAKTLTRYSDAPSHSSDTFRKDNSQEEDEEDEEDTSEDEDSINSRDEETGQQRQFDYFEPDMNIMKPVVNQFKNIKSKLFSLYIAEDDSLKYTLSMGDSVDKFIYKPAENPVRWVQSMVNSELVDQYGLWVVPVRDIRIARFSEELKQQKQNAKDSSEYLRPVNSVPIDNPKGLLSLSTTALVLPEKQLLLVLESLENEFGIKCAISTEYLFFVVCDDVASLQTDLADMTMIIEIGYHSVIHLQVNPSDLIQDCKKKTKAKDSKFKCIMNLQQSYDDKIILGEAILRNQYLVFDQTENMIGFAPAKNSFNNVSFVKKIAHLFIRIEEEIEQDIVFIIIFLSLMILLAASFLFFRHGPTIIALIKGKRVLILDDSSDRVKLASSAHETMDEQAINELQAMSAQMEDSNIHNHFNSTEDASHQAFKPIDLDEL